MRLVALVAGALAAACGPAPSPASPPEPILADAPPSTGPTVVPGTCHATYLERDASAAARREGVLARPRPDDEIKDMKRKAAPTVRVVGEPRVSADVDRAALDEALDHVLDVFHTCYTDALRDNPRFSGTRTITLSITHDGTVSSARVSGRESELRTCVENGVLLAKMPPPTDGGPMSVTISVRFKPPISTTSARRMPRPPPACRGRVDSAPLVAAVSALQRCYDIELLDDPSVGGRLDVRIAPSGAVDLAGDVPPLFADCIGDVLSRAAFDHDLGMATACTLLLDNPATPPTEDEVRVAVELDDVVSVDGSILATADLDAVELPYDVERALRSVIPDPLDEDRALRPRLVVRGHPGVDAARVEAVVHHLSASALTSVSFARRVGTTDGWSVVNPDGSPSDVYCRPDRATVTVLVTTDGFIVHAGGVTAVFESGDREHDLDALSTALTTIRETTLPNRSDLSVAAAPGTIYRDLLRAIELGIQTGFFDTRHAQYDFVSAQLDLADVPDRGAHE